MFRPFSIRPSSGLARGTTEAKLTMLQTVVPLARPEDGLIEKGRKCSLSVDIYK